MKGPERTERPTRHHWTQKDDGELLAVVEGMEEHRRLLVRQRKPEASFWDAVAGALAFTHKLHVSGNACVARHGRLEKEKQVEQEPPPHQRGVLVRLEQRIKLLEAGVASQNAMLQRINNQLRDLCMDAHHKGGNARRHGENA